MNALQTPKHQKTRTFLRVAGPVIFTLGLAMLAITLIEFFFFTGLDRPQPRLFWCGFVGMPLIFAGGVMSVFGFMGAVARYTAAEQVPVARDALNDLAEGTQGAIKTVARSVAEGVDEARKGKSASHDPSA